MAKLDIEGMDELNAALGRIASVPQSVTGQALGEMAAIAAAAIKRTGESMGVRDPESNVHILDKITTTKPKFTPAGGYQDITFSGTRRRGSTTTRNAEIAFINEYGKRGQPARPFMGRAMTENEAKIADAGGEVLGDWIEKEFNR